jgi:hypothetical protein
LAFEKQQTTKAVPLVLKCYLVNGAIIAPEQFSAFVISGKNVRST